MVLMMSKYRVFCTVVELGSFTQAANKLNYSQSAVSQTIKALEQELGTTLVSRQTHRLQLTRDGESFLPFLQDPEQVLHDACEKFIRRFGAMESAARQAGRSLDSLSREELLSLWSQQKTKEQKDAAKA